MGVNRLKNSGTMSQRLWAQKEGKKKGKRRTKGGREGESREREGMKERRRKTPTNRKKRALALWAAVSLVALTSYVVFT